MIISQFCCCCSANKSCPTLQPHGLQHPRLPCPPLSPGGCPSSRPLCWYFYLTTSSSAAPFSFFFQSVLWGLFLKSVGFLHRVAKVLELQLQHQSFQWVFRVDVLQGWLAWSPCSPRDSEESSPALQFKCISFFGTQPPLWPNSHCTWLLEKPQFWLYGPLHGTYKYWIMCCTQIDKIMLYLDYTSIKKCHWGKSIQLRKDSLFASGVGKAGQPHANQQS